MPNRLSLSPRQRHDDVVAAADRLRARLAGCPGRVTGSTSRRRAARKPVRSLPDARRKPTGRATPPEPANLSRLNDRLRLLPPELLGTLARGIEKESLRTRPDGSLALTPHPPALGSALTHPHITTDFSESQLELITGVHGSVESCLEELGQIHQHVYRSIGDELLWAGSMPCDLPPDASIPIANYGNSNIGRAKAVYRIGLSHRYGKRMQTISGIHYNWSMPGLSSDDYFGPVSYTHLTLPTKRIV